MAYTIPHIGTFVNLPGGGPISQRNNARDAESDYAAEVTAFANGEITRPTAPHAERVNSRGHTYMPGGHTQKRTRRNLGHAPRWRKALPFLEANVGKRVGVPDIARACGRTSNSIDGILADFESGDCPYMLIHDDDAARYGPHILIVRKGELRDI